MNNPKIFVLTFPALNHLDSILNLVEVLVSEHHAKVIVYGLEKLEKLVIKSGAEFRSYENYNYIDTRYIPSKTTLELLPSLIGNLLTLTEKCILKIACEIDEERPNLILYDSMALHAKWIIRFLEKNHQLSNKDQKVKKLTSFAPPPIMIYTSGFANQKDIYPNETDKAILFNGNFSEKVFNFFNSSKIMLRTKKLANEFGLDYVKPMDDVYLNSDEHLNIVFTIPEIQPKANSFKKNTKFVGTSWKNNIHDLLFKEDIQSSIKNMIEKFKPLNPTQEYEKLCDDNDERLLYVSFGTVFNDTLDVYMKIIEAIKQVNAIKPTNGVKINKLNAIISVGRLCHDRLRPLFNLNLLSLPNEIIVVESAPQSEILKRASVFITHGGVNSTHEALYYGVPMIIMPMTAHHPLNAHHLEDKLKVCRSVNCRNPNTTEIKNSIIKVLSDESYHKKCLAYSKLLEHSNGAINAANLILDFISNKRVDD